MTFWLISPASQIAGALQAGDGRLAADIAMHSAGRTDDPAELRKIIEAMAEGLRDPVKRPTAHRPINRPNMELELRACIGHCEADGLILAVKHLRGFPLGRSARARLRDRAKFLGCTAKTLEVASRRIIATLDAAAIADPAHYQKLVTLAREFIENRRGLPAGKLSSAGKNLRE